MIRILLVDDHKMMREALCLMLENADGMRVVGEAGDGTTALRMAVEISPDVIVMDIMLPDHSGIEVTQRLLSRCPQSKVIALSSHLERGVVRQMLDAGALGYVAKSAAGAELVQGIRSVFEGKAYLSLDVVALMTDSLRSRQNVALKSGNSLLSARELQVATMLAQGMSTPDIAAQLHISPGTVNTHRCNLMRKLEVHNVADVTRYAVRSRLGVVMIIDS